VFSISARAKNSPKEPHMLVIIIAIIGIILGLATWYLDSLAN
jgi:cytochrome oxidase assembly protein ShyY1